MKKVGYVTGSRAEYGIMRRYLQELNQHKDIDFGLLVTGTHLEKEYGYTVDDIKNDNIEINCEIPIGINTTGNAGILNSMSICLREFGKYFTENKYDLLIILGDRYEMLMVATAAAMNMIPILHLHGGEITLGNYDEFIRHSITKMSKYHFTSTDEYRKRVIQLGENPDNVYYLGALGAENALQNIRNNDVQFKNEKKYMVILFHPETATNIDENLEINELLAALNCFKDEYNLKFIGNNADTNADIIKKRIITYCNENDCEYFVNLKNKDFHHLLYKASCFIGNSSSGIIEAPSLGVFTVNIGDRQKGRIRGNSVIDVGCKKDSIVAGAHEAINRKNKIKIINPYYKNNCLNLYVETTIDILNHIDNQPKEFYDIVFPLSKKDF
jgi:UDP-N-acetylglucosamine 2-epimerase (non-hydrolysing)